jgi:hypothetical protein
MFSTFISLALVISPAFHGVYARQFAASKPEVKACTETYLSWENTESPNYYVYILNPADPCGKELQYVGEFTNTETRFQLKVPEGTSIQTYIEDDLGNDSWGEAVTVTKGVTDCLPDELKPSTPASVPSITKPTPVANTPATNPSAAKPSKSLAPVGAAANAGGILGNDDDSAAPSTRQVGSSVMVFTAIAALAAFAL